MQKQLLLIFISLFSLGVTENCFAQDYNYKNLRSDADSLLKLYVGENLNNSFSFDSSFYYYRNFFNKKINAKLDNKTRIKFNSVEFVFVYAFNDGKNTCYTSVYLNSGYFFEDKLNRPIPLDFLSDSLKTTCNCVCISKDTALAIANKAKTRKGLYTEMNSYFEFNVKTKMYKWTLENIYKESLPDSRGITQKEYEEIAIDAITGNVIYNFERFSGPIH